MWTSPSRKARCSSAGVSSFTEKPGIVDSVSRIAAARSPAVTPTSTGWSAADGNANASASDMITG